MASAASLPLVTVTATCFNHERFVVECLESIRAQTYPNIQLIIADDCSTDGSAEIAEAKAAEMPGVIAWRGRAIPVVDLAAPFGFERIEVTLQTRPEKFLGQVERWDAAETSNQLELLLGRDLQYIRINGTVVGAGVGLILHAVVQAVG